jgi:hypothetical protein
MSFHLFHGTTLGAAQRILNEGWTSVDVPVLIVQIASAHDVDPAEVRQNLAFRETFVTDPQRGRYASFALNELEAKYRWAQSAPEAVYETLCAVWRVKNNVRSKEYADDEWMAEHAWVWEQSKHERLAVIEYQTTYADLERRGALKAVRDFTDFTYEYAPLESSRDLRVTPEVAIPLPFKPPRYRLHISEVSRTVSWDLFAFMLGLSNAEFQALDRAGGFGTAYSTTLDSDLSGFDGKPWWTSQAVDAYLAQSRRARRESDG